MAFVKFSRQSSGEPIYVDSDKMIAVHQSGTGSMLITVGSRGDNPYMIQIAEAVDYVVGELGAMQKR